MLMRLHTIPQLVKSYIWYNNEKEGVWNMHMFSDCPDAAQEF